MVSFPLAHANCSRCWRPLSRCDCETPTLRTIDRETLAALQILKSRVAAGAYSGAADRRNMGQQRWSFLLWMVKRGRIVAG